MKTWLLPLACLGLTLTLSAVAQDAPAPPPAGQGVRAACAADFKKLCGDVQPGDGRIRACIADHKDELSQGCRDALAQAHMRRPQPQGAAGQSPGAQPPKPQQ